MITRLEYDDGDRHRKYWQVEILDMGSTCLVNTEWGRLYDRAPSSQVKIFNSREDAEKHVTRMVKSKLRKGYEEMWGPNTEAKRLEVTA